MKNLLFSFLIVMLISLSGFSQTFVNMPPLNKGEARMLERGMLEYIQANPDFVQSSVYSKLEAIRIFLESTSNTPIAFTNIPVKIIDYIEQRQYGGSIEKWRYAKSNDKQFIDMEQNMVNQRVQSIAKANQELMNKISFQLKYFDLVGLPAPSN